jgi:hypothetical protein
MVGKTFLKLHGAIHPCVFKSDRFRIAEMPRMISNCSVLQYHKLGTSCSGPRGVQEHLRMNLRIRHDVVKQGHMRARPQFVMETTPGTLPRAI